MAASGIWFGVNQLADIDDGSKALAFTILFIALPLIAIIVAAWDGVKEGFSLLWFVAPFVCFLVPMFLFSTSVRSTSAASTQCSASSRMPWERLFDVPVRANVRLFDSPSPGLVGSCRGWGSEPGEGPCGRLMCGSW